jgi:AhpD family alkylhydroperoxidase
MVQPRMKNPAMVLPRAYEAMRTLAAAVRDAGVPEATHVLMHVRASQINGCGLCVDMHTRHLVRLGERPERIHTVAAWREAPYFTDAERAALALAEAATRLADRPDPVPDEVWNEAARHYDEPQLAALLVSIATINAWNRLMATTRQPGGAFLEDLLGQLHARA